MEIYQVEMVAIMKYASSILLLAISLVFSICLLQKPISAEDSDKVLIIIRERYGSAEIQLMGSNEAVLMKNALEEADFKVVIASASGRTILSKNTTLESDFKLADVNIADYVGFIITCSELGPNIIPGSETPLAYGETFVKPQEVAIARKITEAGKPVAAQSKGVIILAEGGALTGKKYSYRHNLPIDGAIYVGQDVVQDGNIITSSYCPYYELQDQTVELTQALITLLQK